MLCVAALQKNKTRYAFEPPKPFVEINSSSEDTLRDLSAKWYREGFLKVTFNGIVEQLMIADQSYRLLTILNSKQDDNDVNLSKAEK